MGTLLLVIGTCIGIGFILGLIWCIVRYVIPGTIVGTWQFFAECVRVNRDNNKELWQVLCARNPDLPQDGPVPSYFVIVRETWNQAWRDVRAKKAAKKQRQPAFK